MIEQTMETMIHRCGVGLKSSGTLLTTRPDVLELYQVGATQLAGLVETLGAAHNALLPALRARSPQVSSTHPFGVQATQELLRELGRTTSRLLQVVQSWPAAEKE
jgi:hypothetical protein